MDQRDAGHQTRCPHCGATLQVSIAYQVEKLGAQSPDFLVIGSDGGQDAAQLFSTQTLREMARDAEAARDQHEMHQRWRGY